MTTIPRLFQPIRVGSATLSHHVVLTPLTRFCTNVAHVHSDIAIEHYTQRASIPGTLLITEAMVIAQKAGGNAHVPGIWNDEQIAAWRKIVDAVHTEGSYIFCQIWALGHAAEPAQLASEDPTIPYVAPSAIKLLKAPFPPRALTISEIKEYVELFAIAASNAVHKAGFDGVELHGANGYLIDQFLQDVSNTCTDEYRGSIENWCRFALEVVSAVAQAVGPDRTAIRLSPWSDFQDMHMADPKPTFEHLVRRLGELHPDLAYIHLVEPRISGPTESLIIRDTPQSNDFLREIWAPKPFISSGGYTRETAIEAAERTGDLIAFERLYVSNPDLPLRLQKNIPLTPPDRSTFYIPEDPKGYNDYPFAELSEL